MAIVKMKKFTLLAFEAQRTELLEKIQVLSEVEFIDLQDSDFLEKNEAFNELNKDNAGSEYAECEEKLSMAKFALEFLHDYIPQKSGLKALRDGKRELTLKELEKAVKESNWESTYIKAKEQEEKFNRLENEKTKLQTIIESLTPWENFDVSFEEFESMRISKFLGSVPKQYEEALSTELNDCYFEVISKNNDDIFFFALCDNDKEEEVKEKLRTVGFSQFKTEYKDIPIKTIHDSMDKIAKLESKKFFVKEELSALDEEYRNLELVNEYYGNIVLRKEATKNFLKTENILVIQGWVAEEEEKEFINVVNTITEGESYLTFEDVKDEDLNIVPTKLKNNELNSAFESITEMFSVPKYDEIDPTPLLTPFYLIFFGMMIADMGYGLIMLLGSLAALKLFKFEEGTRRFMKFFLYLSFPVIVFGGVYGSFFGDLFPNLPRLIDTNTDVTKILILSVLFGLIQIFCGLGIKAYMLIKIGKPKDAFYDVGSWVLTFIGIGLFAGSGSLGLPAIVKYLGIGLMIFGMVTIVLTGGRAEATTGAKLGQGAYSLYGITGYIGDVVSYTRLMALGLSGGSLAGAFNMIIRMLPGASIFIFGPLIFLLGHIFNLALGGLGAYVHTCRLQYVEYFGKFYEGGGRAFTPFKTQDKYINLKK